MDSFSALNISFDTFPMGYMIHTQKIITDLREAKEDRKRYRYVSAIKKSKE